MKPSPQSQTVLAGGPSDARHTARLMALLDRFQHVRVLIIGDLMLDHYIWGDAQRISPEAPVPVVLMTKETFHAGGAGNVVANVRALRGRVRAAGVIGTDDAGRRLLRELTLGEDERAGIVRSPTTATTRKTRILAHGQQIVRLDQEHVGTLGRGAQARLRAFVRRQAQDVDVVVVSDYGKGVIDADLLAELRELRQRHGFLYLIDPKDRNFDHYQGASLIKPNTVEAGHAAGVDIRTEAELCLAGARLLDRWQAGAVLISRGEAGLSLFKPGAPPRHFPTAAREVYDVTGAGDTVLAACALALGAGATVEEATNLANHAAGVVVAKVGAATLHPSELMSHIRGTTV